MNQPTYHNIHSKFKFNGSHCNKSALIRIANDYIDSGLEFEKDCGAFILDWFDDKSFVNVQTSGTTGKPKIIEIEKQAMVNSALATGDFFQLHSGNTSLCCLPVKFIAGKMMLVRAFVLGLELDFVEPNSNPLDKSEKKYDFVAMVPLQVENSLDKLHEIKKLIIGGAKINHDLENKLMASGCEVFETYSMTETVTHIALKRVGEKVFKVLPNVVISQDERNCLVIDAPKLNSQKIVTNDIVELFSASEFSWLGRYDNVINSGGIKLFPEQIEEKLSTKIDKRFFVGGLPDEKLGEKLVLIVEGKKAIIDDVIFDTLSKFEKPKQIYFVSEFPETKTGKIKRKEILQSIIK